MRSVEVGQMQDGGASPAQNVLGFASVAHPNRTAAARMAFVHFGPHLRVIGPIARHLDAAGVGVPERAGDVSRDHRMQVHLVAGQANAVVDEIAALDRAQGCVGVENIGRPLLECRVRKQLCEIIHAACDYAHGSRRLAQFARKVNAGRAGRAYDRNLH
jgi:hypothetical protein